MTIFVLLWFSFAKDFEQKLGSFSSPQLADDVRQKVHQYC